MPQFMALVWSIWYICKSGNLKDSKKVGIEIRNTNKEPWPAVLLAIAAVENKIFMVQVRMKYIGEAVPNEYHDVNYISELMAAVEVISMASMTGGFVMCTPVVGPAARSPMA